MPYGREGSTPFSGTMSKYDKTVLAWVALLTLAVVALLIVLIVVFSISTTWLFMPGGWWVGAMMVWAYGKFTTTGPVAQR